MGKQRSALCSERPKMFFDSFVTKMFWGAILTYTLFSVLWMSLSLDSLSSTMDRLCHTTHTRCVELLKTLSLELYSLYLGQTLSRDSHSQTTSSGNLYFLSHALSLRFLSPDSYSLEESVSLLILFVNCLSLSHTFSLSTVLL